MYTTIILAAAKAAKVSGALLLAICTHESNLKNVEVPHDGGSPSYGICQIKFGTAQMLGYEGSAKGLMNPATNAKWAAQYLRYQNERYEGSWCRVTAAYNAGRYNESQILPGYPRNLKYVRKVQAKLEAHLQHKLSCTAVRKVKNIAEIVKFEINSKPSYVSLDQ